MCLVMMIEDVDNRCKVERLYDAYGKNMFWEAYGILRDRRLAEDAVHESFIRIMRNLHKIDETNASRTKSFLIIICRNVAKDIYNQRHTSTTVFVEDPDYFYDTESNCPESIVITRESMERIVHAIERLNPIYRDVFLLNRAHGLSCREIAKTFGITEDAVKKRLSRAKKMVLERLGREEAYSGR